MLHQKETERVRAYPTHQVVQTTGSTANHALALARPQHASIGEVLPKIRDIHDSPKSSKKNGG